MKITRTKLNLNSLAYSREFDVERSVGCHLMQVVDYIGQTSGMEKKRGNEIVNLDPFAVVGFVWEHCMTRAEQIEHALSVEALRVYMTPKKSLSFPGEQLWCRQCNKFIPGGESGREHCKTRKHTGIFFTPDAFDKVTREYVEWKATWKSSNSSHPAKLNTAKGIWRWPVQCQFNALGLGVTKARLIALHVMGAYGYGMPKPQPYVIRMEFTDRELRRTKDMIVSNSIEMGWI